MGLSHVDEQGQARMVDVGHKAETERLAKVRGRILISAEALEAIQENKAAKGDVLAAARLAGIMAAKRTPELIPLCHPLPLTSVKVEFELHEPGPNGRARVEVEATAKTLARTGVEMEALTGASVALMTIYDMLKAVDKRMEIGSLRLVYKSGGKSGLLEAE